MTVEEVIAAYRKRTEDLLADGALDEVLMQNVLLLAILDELRAQR